MLAGPERLLSWDALPLPDAEVKVWSSSSLTQGHWRWLTELRTEHGSPDLWLMRFPLDKVYKLRFFFWVGDCLIWMNYKRLWLGLWIQVINGSFCTYLFNFLIGHIYNTHTHTHARTHTRSTFKTWCTCLFCREFCHHFLLGYEKHFKNYI